MRIVLDTQFTNPDLPLVDPLFALITPELIAGYGMQSNKDFSGNGRDFTWGGSFSSAGAVLTNDANGIITTPVTEQDAMTIIFAWNIAPVSGQISHVIGNMTPAAAPFSGFRHYINASAVGNTSAGTGLASPQTQSFSGGAHGAWTAQALTISPTKMQKVTHSGSVLSVNLTSRSKSPLPFYVNGVPADVAAPQRGGLTGTIGLLAFYKAEYSVDKIKSLLDGAASIMAERGVTVP